MRRTTTFSILFVISFSGFHSESCAQEDAWVSGAEMPMGREGGASCAVGGRVYIFGGSPEFDSPGTNSNMEYTPATDSWTNRAPMPTPRFGASAAVLDGRCHVVGGATDHRSAGLTTHEIYDPDTNAWSSATELATGRHTHATVALDGEIWAIGGTQNGVDVLNSVEIYDPASGAWSDGPPLMSPRGALFAEVLGGSIYAGGGTNTLGPFIFLYSSVEKYEPATTSWSMVSSMPTGRWWLASAIANGRIYTVGGHLSDANEEYDPVSDSWTERTNLPSLLFRPFADSVDDKIYVFGGLTNDIPGWPASRMVRIYTPPGAGAGFQINAGLNGNWWNGPGRNGEGVQVEVADGGGGSLVFVATLYSYDTMGNQIFLVAVGPVNGNSAQVDVFITDGGVWGGDFDPELVNERQWGMGTFTANSCGSISMALMPNAEFQGMGYTNLAYDLVRLTTPKVACPFAGPN